MSAVIHIRYYDKEVGKVLETSGTFTIPFSNFSLKTSWWTDTSLEYNIYECIYAEF